MDAIIVLDACSYMHKEAHMQAFKTYMHIRGRYDIHVCASISGTLQVIRRWFSTVSKMLLPTISFIIWSKFTAIEYLYIFKYTKH